MHAWLGIIIIAIASCIRNCLPPFSASIGYNVITALFFVYATNLKMSDSKGNLWDRVDEAVGYDTAMYIIIYNII